MTAMGKPLPGALDDAALDRLFREARTFGRWSDRPLEVATIHALYELVKMGPTSMNTQPGRFLFLHSRESRERLVPALSAGNVDKVREAPLTVVVAHDSRFQEHLPTLWPHAPGARDDFDANPERAAGNAFRNGTLQGGYLILAARALGLDCGPMSGFSNAKLDAEFFPDGRWRSNFLVNVGYGDRSKLYPRGPRLDFETAARIL